MPDAVPCATASADRDEPVRWRRPCRPARAGDSSMRSHAASRLEFRYPSSLIELTRMLHEEVQAGTPMVAVGGGDGTLHHAINAIARCADHAGAAAQRDGQRLLPQPGSGADAGAGAGGHRPGRSRLVDVLAINGVRVLTVAGLGVVSSSALQVGRMARRGHVARPIVRAFGSLAYLGAAGARLLFEPRLARHATVRWRTAPDGGLATGRRAVLRHLPGVPARAGSGSATAARRWTPDDGRFEIVLVERSARLSVAMQLPKLRSGRARAARHAVDSPGDQRRRSSGRTARPSSAMARTWARRRRSRRACCPGAEGCRGE